MRPHRGFVSCKQGISDILVHGKIDLAIPVVFRGGADELADEAVADFGVVEVCLGQVGEE
jgi:hypothetical protein